MGQNAKGLPHLQELHYPDMSEDDVARHDEAIRTVILALTKGQQGSHYLVADVGNTRRL